MASFIFRSRVLSGVRSATFTSCWVMVEPPSRRLPEIILKEALIMPWVSKPW